MKGHRFKPEIANFCFDGQWKIGKAYGLRLIENMKLNGENFKNYQRFLKIKLII